MNFKIDTLGKKIGFGYLLIALVLAFSVLTTVFQVRKISNLSGDLIQIRQPSARADLELMNGLNKSIGEIRGWILFKRDTFKIGRRNSWKSEIRPALAALEELSGSWINPENVERLSLIIAMVDRMEQYQERVEDLAVTDTEAAVALMDEKLLPLNKEIIDMVNILVVTHERLMNEDFANIDRQISLLHTIEWILLAAGLFISAILAYFITRSITAPVAGAVEVAQNIGAGNLQTAVDVGGSSELEKLGNALIEMRDSLIQKTEETQRYTWLSNGQNLLNEKLRGDQTISELADNVISFMADYLEAGVGSVFLLDDHDHKLTLAGKYAYPKNGKAKSFELGESLIGQAAIEKKMLSLTTPDTDAVRISTSVMEVIPAQVIVSPFLFEGKTLGVIELGRLIPFKDTEITFINASMESLAISFNSAIARKKIQELLEETRVQSEELQSQQEELRQVNEELEEHAQNLRQQQEELQVTNEELEEQAQAMELKNREIELAKSEIEQKSKLLEVSSKYKSEFLANMSHELRTPLNSLLILSKDMSENKLKNLTDDQVESAEIIYKSGADLLQLINEVLDLSKIEAGKMTLDVKRTSLKSIVEEISRNFKLQAQQKGLEFTFSIDKKLPEYLYTDRMRLNQILKNLLSNAFKFTEKGSVRLNVTAAQNDRISFEVTDTGIGIPESKQMLIFEAFQQGEGGTSRKYGGTGLGLSISRELARLLDGTISIASKVGKGSVFTLTIPKELSDLSATDAPGLELKEERINTAASFQKDPDFIDYPAIQDDRDEILDLDRVILIIEDDMRFAATLTKQAHEKRFKCLVAGSGEDGLTLAEKYKPHAIILDIELPGMDGHQVLSMLKSNPSTRHIPVHIISAWEDSFPLIREGAIEYLAKPVDKPGLDGVFQRIEGFIDRKMKNLLIIEDDENARKAMKKLIGNGDVKCLEAASGQEAIDILGTTHVDCIVLDIGLPDISGFTLIERLSELKKNLPPIVVYTGKELTKEQNMELQSYTESIIIKGVKSEDRLLDETALFLHRTVNNMPEQKQRIISGLYDKQLIFQDKKILLTDDDMRNIFALSKILRERGMEVHKAENGKIALDVLSRIEGIHMVLMDIMMPEMDGYETMKAIRANSKYKNLPIIALTAKAMKDDKQKCIDAGANDYISKPVDADRLLSLMSVWLNK